MKRIPLSMAALACLLAAALLSPLVALWLPDRWRRHVYDEISFQFITQTRLPRTDSPKELMEAAMDYTRDQLWLLDDPQPYGAKSFRYLVDGVGWCDYVAKVFCQLLVHRGMRARYAFLQDAEGISPHTIAEVSLNGKWLPVDPFYHLIFVDEHDAWPTLEELTPGFVERLPQLAELRKTTSESDEAIETMARRTMPLPLPPQRSDDFSQEKHLLDRIAGLYVNLGGRPFAEWYQDRYLPGWLASVEDPADRLWLQARNYHLYGRFGLAEMRYRQLLALGPPFKYRERTTLFLSRVLIRRERFLEAREILNRLAQEKSDAPWLYFHLALCDQGLGDRAQEVIHLRAYQELRGDKYALEAAGHLRRLQPERGV